MIDRLLAAGSVFDWITPLTAFIQDVVNGLSHTLLIPHGCGRAPRQIGSLLRAHGVRWWGMMVVNDTLMITVRRRQARWADYLVQREGIPLLNPLTGAGGLPVEPVAAGARPSRSRSASRGHKQPGYWRPD